MYVTIHDQDFPLVKSNVALSRKYISKLISSVKESGEKSHDDAFYPTFLIMMSYMSSVLLDEFPIAELQSILSAEAEADKQRKKLEAKKDGGNGKDGGGKSVSVTPDASNVSRITDDLDDQ